MTILSTHPQCGFLVECRHDIKMDNNLSSSPRWHLFRSPHAHRGLRDNVGSAAGVLWAEDGRAAIHPGPVRGGLLVRGDPGCTR
jgi:hypothetical protein